MVFTTLKLKSGLENKIPRTNGKCLQERFFSWHMKLFVMKVLFNAYRSSGVLEHMMDITVILLKPDFQESEQGDDDDNIKHNNYFVFSQCSVIAFYKTACVRGKVTLTLAICDWY